VKENTKKAIIEEESDSSGNTYLKMPLLELEVTITRGQVRKLVILDGDDPKEVVDMFAMEHDLEPAKKAKLMSIVSSNLLQNIGEVDDEEETYTNCN